MVERLVGRHIGAEAKEGNITAEDTFRLWGHAGTSGVEFANLERGIAMAYVIAEPCIGTKDTACVDVCPVDCIHPRKDETDYEAVSQLYIDPVECIDCGACVPVCPVTAIFPVDDLPEKWQQFTEVNSNHFNQ